MGDNDRNPEAMKEIVLPIRQDGTKTKTYGGTWTIISSCYASGCQNFYGTNYLRMNAVGDKAFNNILANVTVG